MITNTAITVYNKYIEARAEKYQRAEILAVLWESSAAVAKRRQANVSTNKAVIAIPFSECGQYSSPTVWQSLEKLVRATRWTLKDGDVVVRGIVTDEISDVFNISALRAKYEDVLEIVSVDRMDQGSPNTRHWEVGCK